MPIRLPLLLLFLWLACAAGTPGRAQSGYDPHAAFSPLDYPPAATGGTRNADGSPGPDYWQNRADYQIAARFDTASKRLSGEVTITYTNHSPAFLPFLWLYLDQNIDRSDSRASRIAGDAADGTGRGLRLEEVDVVQNGKSAPVPYVVDGTRMQVRLPRPVHPKGDSVVLKIRYSYMLLPSGGGDRSGYLDTRGGRIFEVSYWYPRMCVYDDLRGWNTLPFLGGGEFYMDYGNIDYRITLPRGLIVAGSGTLLNPAEVLRPEEIRRLQQAARSEKPVVISRPGEHAAQPEAATGDWQTWHFRMDNTRDVAWAASAAFVWDAARIDLPGGKSALAMSVYPEESAGDSLWGRATEYLKNAVEIFSRSWYPYPYPVAINVAGPVGGMEFPGITFDWWRAGRKSLFALLSHEIGHNWYPMIVGSNERRHAWMDEGFNTFIDIYAQQLFHQGEYAPKRDGEYAPGGGNPAEEILPFITRPGINPIVSRADALPTQDVHPLEYYKTAFGLVLLREVILGPARFDYAFRKYTADWAYKHPSPRDFFHEMDNGAGEDLSWFWKGWFLKDWKLDQAVESVRYVDGDPKKGALITLRNRQQLPMPVLVRITGADGASRDLHLPVEGWEKGDTWTFRVPTAGPLRSVVLDPDHVLPDIDRSNNSWNP